MLLVLVQINPLPAIFIEPVLLFCRMISFCGVRMAFLESLHWRAGCGLFHARVCQSCGLWRWLSRSHATSFTAFCTPKPSQIASGWR